MRCALLGVRGSTPAPGPQFARYGGHTSCVALFADGGAVPALVLDAGTGVRGLPDLLGGHAFDGSIVLSHLHWDHVHGLPFCPAVDRPDARVDLFLPTPAGRGPSAARDLLARAMSPPHFPIPPEGLLGSWRFGRSPLGPVTIEGFTVTQAEITHKGGLTHGIRVERDGVSLAYMPDHAPQLGANVIAGGPHLLAAEELARGVDLLLHDGQFLDHERATADSYGHSTVGAAVDFAVRCGARRLVLTHHAPGRADDDLDKLAADLAGSGGSGLFVELARQGDTLSVP